MKTRRKMSLNSEAPDSKKLLLDITEEDKMLAPASDGDDDGTSVDLSSESAAGERRIVRNRKKPRTTVLVKAYYCSTKDYDRDMDSDPDMDVDNNDEANSKFTEHVNYKNWVPICFTCRKRHFGSDCNSDHLYCDDYIKCSICHKCSSNEHEVNHELGSNHEDNHEKEDEVCIMCKKPVEEKVSGFAVNTYLAFNLGQSV